MERAKQRSEKYIANNQNSVAFAIRKSDSEFFFLAHQVRIYTGENEEKVSFVALPAKL